MRRQRDPFRRNRAAWFITINTNSDNQALIRPLMAVWNYLTSHIQQFVHSEHQGRVLSVKRNSGIEIGDKLHRVHLHGYIVIEGEGHIYLTYSKIKDFIDKQLRRVPGFAGIHFDAQPIKNYDPLSRIEDYIEPVVVPEGEEFEIIL